MKAAQYLWLSVTSLGLIACAPVEAPPSEPMTRSSMAVECEFPGTTQGAPAWVCDVPVAGASISVVGIAEPTRAGIAFQKNLAATDALGQLAEYLDGQASKQIKAYAAITGVGDNETVDKAADTVINTFAHASVIGARRSNSATGPEGRMYLLMTLAAKDIEANLKKAIQTSMNNNPAAWHVFNAEKAHNELAARIAKRKTGQ